MPTNPFDEVNANILAEIRQYHERAIATDAVPSGFQKVTKGAAQRRWKNLSKEMRQQEIAARGADAILGDFDA